MASALGEVVDGLGVARASGEPLLAGADAAAWLVLIPCVLLTVAAVVLLGPVLGRLAFPHDASAGFWSPRELKPEPTEQGRYIVLALAPLLLAGATIAASRDRLGLTRLAPALRIAIVAVAQLSLIAFIVVCWAGQYKPSPGIIFFTPATLITAGGIALLLTLLVWTRPLYASCAAVLRETRVRRILALAVAIAMTAIWLLHAIHTDTSIGWANSITRYHIQFALDEAFAVVNGLTPLVDYSAQYGSLMPYATAIALSVFGKTMLVFTITMCTMTGLALLAIFGVLRRVTRSSLAALLLYLPLMSTSFFLVIGGTLVDRHTFASYFPMFPLRYAGPYLLAWLTARHLARDAATRTWPLFVVAGLVVLNNTEFGIGGFVATVGAVLWVRRDFTAAGLLRLAGAIVVGLVAAYALVSMVTLARAGSLPELDRLTAFARIYLVSGFGLIPMPRVFGFHLIIYITYVAAIGAATVQAVRHDANRVLTGMLAWSGIFGLGAASYYVGRSADDTLPATFSAWALAIALLTVVAVLRTADKRRRLPTLALLAVFYGMGIVTCSLAQTPMPWTQLDRIRHAPDGQAAMQMYVPQDDPALRELVTTIADGPHRFVFRRGAPILLFDTIGHRIADAYGVRDVMTTTGLDSIHTLEQFNDSLDALRAAGGNTVLLPSGPPQTYELLAQHGFSYLSANGLRRWTPDTKDEALATGGPYSKWIDMRHLHPRALE